VGEFDRSERLQEIVGRSQSACLVVEHDFGLAQLSTVLGKTRRVLLDTYAAEGHPWAALVAFDAVVVARLKGFSAVCRRREWSVPAAAKRRRGSGL